MAVLCPRFLGHVAADERGIGGYLSFSFAGRYASLSQSSGCEMIDRLILMFTYSAGLRVSEVVKLKLGDIDIQRGLIHVKGAKGRKDRYDAF
ncbi:MAG: tyrosine-type recombinase/integrase [Nitrospiraceae bacterium]|nr:tyrosine-type recombinase/integrase [Nitrospiraceae bacterium]